MRGCSFPKFVVKKLTLALRDMLIHEAERALVGDQTCSLKNMQQSCFATEVCNSKAQDWNIPLLIPGVDTYVVYTNCDSESLDYIPHVRFVGCAAVSSLNDMNLISNFCVAEAYRGHGVGRMIIDHCESLGKRLCVKVFTGTDGPCSDEARLELKCRVKRLLETYSKLKFQPEREYDHYVLLTRRT